MELTIKTTENRQVIDITDNIVSLLPDYIGVVNIFVQHTTAAITTADLDPGTDLDFLDFLELITPESKWRHPHNPKHAPDHLLASMIGSNVTVPFGENKLTLGMWQRIVLIELGSGRDRKITLSFQSDYKQ